MNEPAPEFQRTLEFRGIHADILKDTTREQSIEGSLSSGKTILALWRELDALEKYAGIWSLIARWTDDAVSTKLIPEFEKLCRIRGLTPAWNREEKSYDFDNGSRAFMFGLKAVSMIERYNKIRGLPVSRICVDQAEEIPEDIAGELRGRLRPDIISQMVGRKFPFQLTFVSNPVDTDHWIAKDFPINNPHRSRKMYSLSLFDNAHNLDPEMIEGMLLSYPSDHPKNQTVIMGLRGPNIIGKAIFGGIYQKSLHHKPASYRVESEVWEAYEVGKHNPVWICCQPMYAGGLVLLGGVFGEGLMLQDFLPRVKEHRAKWLPATSLVRSCSGPMGLKHTSEGSRYTTLNILQQAGIHPVWRDNAGAPDVENAIIENIAGYMRRRNIRGEECFLVNDDPSRWLKAMPDGSLVPYPFAHFAFEGGAVWSEHWVSVSHDKIRQPNDDDKFANVLRCVESIELNFCADQLSEMALEEKRLKAAREALQYATPNYGATDGGWMGS